MSALDPLGIMSLVLMQLGGKYINFNLTKGQEELVKHPITQVIIFGCIIYFTTKNIVITVIVVMISYILIHILFNEYSEFNIFSEDWLYKNKIIKNKSISSKELYKNNIDKYHK